MRGKFGVLAFAAVLTLPAGCRKGPAPADAGEKTTPAPDLPTPVRVATVGRRTLTEVVSAPGHTAALSQQKVRAPFAGTLLDARVLDGDVVRRGQVLATIVSRETEAALSGAREMQREARTPAEHADADRAVVLGERNLVRKAVVASADGPVLSHAAAAGDRVAEDQELFTIADSSTVVFLVDVGQVDLPRIRPGQPASVELGGGQNPIAGRVHSILPGANAVDFTGPVRIDLPPSSGRLPMGLFGTARITTGERPNSLVVPDAAVLKDDVTGISRVAAIVDRRLHWIEVQTGLKQDGVTEIRNGNLPDGSAVAITGMVGLPEGKTVSIAQASAPAAAKPAKP